MLVVFGFVVTVTIGGAAAVTVTIGSGLADAAANDENVGAEAFAITVCFW